MPMEIHEDKIIMRAGKYNLPKPWVGLTDEDKTLFSSWLDHKTDYEVFAAIEDKLRSKNT